MQTDVTDRFWSQPIGQKLLRMYGKKLPILPGREVLAMTVIMADHRGAVRHDDCNCLLACTARRQSGSPGIVVDREKAYIGKEVFPGVWAIFYYMIPVATAVIWQRFDEGTLGLWTGTVFFNPVPPHELHPVRRARRTARRTFIKREKAAGRSVTIKPQEQPKRLDPFTLEARRDGRYRVKENDNEQQEQPTETPFGLFSMDTGGAG